MNDEETTFWFNVRKFCAWHEISSTPLQTSTRRTIYIHEYKWYMNLLKHKSKAARFKFKDNFLTTVKAIRGRELDVSREIGRLQASTALQHQSNHREDIFLIAKIHTPGKLVVYYGHVSETLTCKLVEVEVCNHKIRKVIVVIQTNWNSQHLWHQVWSSLDIGGPNHPVFQ